jgi:uncharacterized protein (DUF433 family)
MPPVKLDFDIGSYLESDPDHMEGRPYIRGTRVSVQRVGILYSQGFTPDEIAYEMNLELPSVHAALAFYLARRDEIEQDIDEQEAEGLRLMEEYRAALAR